MATDPHLLHKALFRRFEAIELAGEPARLHERTP